MNKEEIGEAVSGTGLAELAIGYRVIALLKYKGILVEEFTTYFEGVQRNQREELKQAEEIRRHRTPFAFTCPECGKRAVLAPVIIRQGKDNVYGWKSVLRCWECGWEKFSKQPLQSRLKKLRRSMTGEG